MRICSPTTVYRCLELFLEHCAEALLLHNKGGHAVAPPARSPSPPRASRPSPPPPPPGELDELLSPAEREGLRHLFVHFCASCAATGSRAVSHSCAMRRAQFLVLLREAGVVREAGLRACVCAFADRAVPPLSLPQGEDSSGSGDGSTAAAPALDFGRFLDALSCVAAHAPARGGDDEGGGRLARQLLGQAADLLLLRDPPAAPQFVELVITGGGGGGAAVAQAAGAVEGFEAQAAATYDVAACAWRDDALLALYEDERCLERLCGGGRQGPALVRRLFGAFAVRDGGGSGGGADSTAESALIPAGAVALLRSLGLVAPSSALQAHGGRGLTVMEGLHAMFAARPRRLQSGAPKQPDPIRPDEFGEWLHRCALAAFAWRPAPGSGGAARAGPAPFRCADREVRAAFGRAGPPAGPAAFQAAWLSPPGVGAGGGWDQQQQQRRRQHAPFDTTATFGREFGAVGHTAPQLARLRALQLDARAAEAEAAAARALRLAAARFAALEDRAAAAARREALQLRSSQAVVGASAAAAAAAVQGAWLGAFAGGGFEAIEVD